MKIFVIIPTYNEKENINKLLDEIIKLKIKNLKILVVDDNSPDKTWKIVEEKTNKDKKIHLLLRKNNKGRGYAGKDGFIYVLKKGADIIIEMDADFSHNPKYIPKLLKEIKNFDVVLGSRLIEGGSEKGRVFIREMITYFANLYIRIMFGLKIRDCNSGYRCFRRNVLEKIAPGIEASGPEIIQEVLFKAHINRFKIGEIPIKFVNRIEGKSKLGIKQLAQAYFIVLKLSIKKNLSLYKK